MNVLSIVGYWIGFIGIIMIGFGLDLSFIVWIGMGLVWFGLYSTIKDGRI